jgi:hypothetical protein
MWIGSLRRRWTGKEKFAAMGFPVYTEHAGIAGVKEFDYSSVKDPHQRIGNSMHVVSLGVALAAVLMSVELVGVAAQASTPGTLAASTASAKALACIYLYIYIYGIRCSNLHYNAGRTGQATHSCYLMLPIYIYIYIHINVYIYIYIYTYIHIYTYIYI